MKRAQLAALASALAVASFAFAAEPPVEQVQQKVREIESAILRGKVDAVRMQLQEQARNRPGDVQLRVYLAWCDMPQDAAWNTLKGIASIYPDQPWVRLGMGRVYTKWKMREQAEAEFKAALGKNPGFYPALVGLGDVARQANDLAAAVGHYQQALKLHDDAEARAGLGLAYLAQHQQAEAKAELARAVTLWPDQPVALRELAALCRGQGDLSAAADWGEKLAELTPKDGLARKALGDLRFEAGQKEQAAKDYERALKLGVVDVALYRRLAGLYREAKNPEAEQRALEQLSVLEKQDPEHPLRLSELAEAREDLEAAEAQLLEALDRAPARADLHAKLARLRVKRNDPLQALDAFRAALAAPDGDKAGVEAEAQALADGFRLPKRKASGGVDAIYGRVAANLNVFYKERLKAKPGLRGWIKIRVRVNEDGAVAGADVLEDSVEDPQLAGHAYFSLKDAQYPKKKREPVFEFELRPPKGK